MISKIKHAYLKLREQGLDGLILSSPGNITYLADYLSRDSYLIISKEKNFYITDCRYTREAKKNLNLKDFTVKETNGLVFKIIAGLCRGLKLKQVGFEERHLPYAEYKKIKENLHKSVDLIPTHGLIEELREVKTETELKKIKKAVHITTLALEFIKDFIRVGKKEVEIAGELQRFIRYHGARCASFEIIVASGPNSSFPHHLTAQRKIKNHEPVLIDMGVDYLGYKCDLTRVFFLGKITSLFRTVYDIVKEAQSWAIRQIKPGVSICKIDAAGRNYIAQKGYGKFFGHNLGHGIGLEIHEAPHICGKEDAELKAGMVFTVEPGIYLPGKFGVRLEDMVLVNQKAGEILSGSLNK